MVQEKHQTQGSQEVIKNPLMSGFLIENKGKKCILANTWAISLMVEQRSPKPLVGVRFFHRPQIIIFLSGQSTLFLYFF